MTVTHYLLTLLSVLYSSSGDGDLACYISIFCLFSLATVITLHLCAAYPTGGFLTVGDGVFSIDGLEFGSSTFSNHSSQSEELHQQYISPHLSQNSQYLPRNLLLPACSSSSFMWDTAAAYFGSVKTWGGYLNPWPTGTSVSDVLSSVCMFVISLQGVFLFLVLTLLLLSAFSQAWYFSVLVWMSWTMLNFPHLVLTFISTSRASAGILQNRYPSRSQVAFSDLSRAILELMFWVTW